MSGSVVWPRATSRTWWKVSDFKIVLFGTQRKCIFRGERNMLYFGGHLVTLRYRSVNSRLAQLLATQTEQWLTVSRDQTAVSM